MNIISNSEDVSGFRIFGIDIWSINTYTDLQSSF